MDTWTTHGLPVRVHPFVTALCAVAFLAVTGCGAGSTASLRDSGSGAGVTVYTADGLGEWYTAKFAEFERKTGIKVAPPVKAGSGEIVDRLQRERSAPTADVLITLPPFVQRAAESDLLAEYSVPGREFVPEGLRDPRQRFTAVLDNFFCLVYNTRQATPPPNGWSDLLDPRYKGKLQYSTPGQAGDGTAMLLLLQHVLGPQGARDYLAKLESSNAGPIGATSPLQPKVNNGDLLVANSDTQLSLAAISTISPETMLFFPAGPDGKKATMSIPHFAGLVKGAPHAAAGRRLLEFLLSEEVQRTATEAYAHPVRIDVPGDGVAVEQLDHLLVGVDVWRPDWTAILAALAADVAAYRKAVGR
ncbi:2-aminoethylphosphonate ABC transporter substrate-binding protein [Pseudonocardiaceae bacterium YIM PH 21723]|nr:2-aminoethylphosphonate ABC transporter substrate-binding protein [Pseudonocardiaceae bacterium YIM PH 21723]